MLLIFFFNDTATTEIYTLSLHDALPILSNAPVTAKVQTLVRVGFRRWHVEHAIRVSKRELGFTHYEGRSYTALMRHQTRSEEHTSELQSRQYLVCRLLLEKTNTLSYIQI